MGRGVFTALPNLPWLTPRHPSLLLPESQTEKWGTPGAAWGEEFSGTALRAEGEGNGVPPPGENPSASQVRRGVLRGAQGWAPMLHAGSGVPAADQRPFLRAAPERLPHLSRRSRGPISHPDSPYPSNRIGTSRFPHLGALAQPLIRTVTRASDGYEDLLRPPTPVVSFNPQQTDPVLLMAPFTDEARTAGG